MEVAQILIKIFGKYPSLTEVDYTTFVLKDHIRELTKWLDEQLDDEEDTGEITAQLMQMGCLGPSVKMFDVKGDSAHTVNVSKDWLTLQSQTPFSSVKANCCVFKGKWMYEVQLRSKGIMQIGWCSVKCVFTQDTGVGDTRNSYGLDGSKQRLWHVQTRKYGPYWRSGDVFGICLDMDIGRIEYYRNGMALGEAFKDIERGAGMALFPAVSMAYNDSITANFGGSPFRHPVDGYEPLQAPPKVMLKNADFLLQRTVALARLMSLHGATNSVSDGLNAPSTTAIHLVIAGVLLGALSKVFANAYVVEEKAYLYIKSMCVLRSGSESENTVYPGSPESTLGTFLTLLWSYLDHKDTKLFLGRLVLYLSSVYRETPNNLDYEKQRTVVVVLTCLCNHPKTRRFLLEHRFFKKNCLPVFLYIKPPDELTLAELLPSENVWTAGIGGSKKPHMDACDKLKRSTDVLYSLQKNLVQILMINDDHESACTASSQKLFTSRIRRYVLENCMEHRSNEFLQGSRGTPTQPAVSLSLICLLLDVLRDYFKKHPDTLAHVRPINFYDGSLQYSFYERLGGVISHLSKAFNIELLERIGESGVEAVDAIVDQRGNVPSDMSIYSAMFLITGGNSSIASIPDGSLPNANVALYVEPTTANQAHAYDNLRELSAGPANELASMTDLLDCCVMYYYGVAHKYIVMIAELRDSIGALSEILMETKTSFDDIRTTIEEMRCEEESLKVVHDDILSELNDKFDNRKNVFILRSIELARKQVWYRSVALGERRRSMLNWMLNSILQTLGEATNDGVLFAFVPETYVNILPILLDTCLDFCHHDLKPEYDHSDIQDVLLCAGEFLAKHSADLRIVLASSKDAMLQALGTMTCHAAGVRTLERISEGSQLALVQGLLRPYENRAWGQSNWLLNRFWLGEGFAYRDARAPSVWQSGNLHIPQGLVRSRGKTGAHTGLLHHVAPACPSAHFHALICEVLTNDEPFSTIFINSILSQLNWAFSEFVLLLQEIQNNVQRHDQRHLSESRQLKICSMCFELTVSLMRSLEMLLTIAPAIFKDVRRPNSDLLLNRVCQLISQVLARVTIPPGVFQFVIDLCLPDLSMITHFSIITAAIGILTSLLCDEIRTPSNASTEALDKVMRITRILLSDPSFHLAHLEFTLGQVDAAQTVFNAKPVPKGNFDPQSRVNIDPLTNEVRIVSSRLKKPEQPIIQFNLMDYCSHVSVDEIKSVQRMIEYLRRRTLIMSEIALPSDDNICPICYAKSVSAIFEPCKHQSCANCIVQHLMNNKVCFYCKTQISRVQNFDGKIIYDNVDLVPAVPTTDESMNY